MSAQNYEELRAHLGHNVTVVGYGEHGDAGEPNRTHFDNVAVECEDCGEVLLDFDRAPEESDDSPAFTVNIDLGNDAMQSRADVAQALRDIATLIERANQDEGSFRDANGNTTGGWAFT